MIENGRFDYLMKSSGVKKKKRGTARNANGNLSVARRHFDRPATVKNCAASSAN